MNEVIERLEILVVDAQPAKEFPDSFDRIEFGAVWRKVVEVQARWTGRRMMIAGVVGNKDRPAATIAVPGQVL